jgi:hypothetical protein
MSEGTYDILIRPILSTILVLLVLMCGVFVYYRWLDHAKVSEVLESHFWAMRGKQVIEHGPFIQGDDVYFSRTYCQHDPPLAGHRTLILKDKWMVTMPDVGILASKECPFKSNRKIPLESDWVGKFTYCTSYDFYVNPFQRLQTVIYPCDDFEVLPNPEMASNKGAKGEAGPAGPTGATGATGAAGASGQSGAAGTNGLGGLTGQPGRDGRDANH